MNQQVLLFCNKSTNCSQRSTRQPWRIHHFLCYNGDFATKFGEFNPVSEFNPVVFTYLFMSLVRLPKNGTTHQIYLHSYPMDCSVSKNSCLLPPGTSPEVTYLITSIIAMLPYGQIKHLCPTGILKVRAFITN